MGPVVRSAVLGSLILTDPTEQSPSLPTAERPTLHLLHGAASRDEVSRFARAILKAHKPEEIEMPDETADTRTVSQHEARIRALEEALERERDARYRAENRAVARNTVLLVLAIGAVVWFLLIRFS